MPFRQSLQILCADRNLYLTQFTADALIVCLVTCVQTITRILAITSTVSDPTVLSVP